MLDEIQMEFELISREFDEKIGGYLRALIESSALLHECTNYFLKPSLAHRTLENKILTKKYSMNILLNNGFL